MSGERSRRVIAVWFGLVVLGGVLVGPAPDGSARTASGPESGSSDWRTVVAGNKHTCGIRTSGRLYCWGSDTVGQLGDGGTNTNQPAPVQVFGGATNWASVSLNGGHTCARRATGRLFCWGSDSAGQLGDGGPNTSQPVPVAVFGGLTDWTAVSVGATHTCARRVSGRLYCWGADFSGQLGNGGLNTDRPIPALVAGGATNWTSVTAGDSHSCGRRANGRIYCWGYDGDGELGDGGPNAEKPVPTPVFGGATNWTSVVAGDLHTCARRATGRLYCWGSDSDGQIGDGGGSVDRTVPQIVAGGAINWTSVAPGGGHTCARRTTGRLYCWGNDSSGELGDGGADADSQAPVQVAGGATDWTLVDAGGAHACARITSGRLLCWGLDAAGQLGDGGTNTDQGRPAQVFAP